MTRPPARLLAAMGAFALLAGAALPAAAGDAKCLIQHLPADKRAQVEALYASSVEEGLASSLYSEADFDAMLAACKVAVTDEAKLTAAAQALAGYEAETGIAIWLKANRDIDEPTLDRIWNASRLGDPAVAEAAASDDALVANLALDLASRLGLEGQPDLTNLAGYVSARLLRTTSERRF